MDIDVDRLNRTLISLVGRGKRKDVEVTAENLARAWAKYGSNRHQLSSDVIGTMAKVVRNETDAFRLLNDAKSNSIKCDCYIVSNILRSLSNCPFTKQLRISALKILLMLDDEPNNMVVGNLAFFVSSCEDVDWILKFTNYGQHHNIIFKPFPLTKMMIEDLSCDLGYVVVQSKLFVNRQVKLDKVICGNLMNACIEHFGQEEKGGNNKAWDLLNLMNESHIMPNAIELSILCKTVSCPYELHYMLDLFSSIDVRLNALSYVTLMKACIRNFCDAESGYQMAWWLHDKTIEAGLKPTPECFSILSKAVTDFDKFAKIKNLIDMHGFRLKWAYVTILENLPSTPSGNQIAWQLTDEMIEKRLQLTTACLNILANAASDLADIERVKSLAALHHIRISEFAYDALTNAAVATNDPQRREIAWQLLNEMISKTFMPTINCLDAMAGIVSNIEELERIRQLFGSQNLSLGLKSYYALICSFIDNFSDKSEGRKHVWLLFEELLGRDLKPNLKLLTALSKTVSDLTGLEMMKGFFLLYDVKMNLIAYSTMIASCIENFEDKSKGKQGARSLLEKLVGDGLVPSLEILNNLCKVIVNENDLNQMNGLFSRYDVAMNLSSYNAMIGSCINHFPDKSEAFDCVTSLKFKMEGAKIEPNEVTEDYLKEVKYMKRDAIEKI